VFNPAPEAKGRAELHNRSAEASTAEEPPVDGALTGHPLHERGRRHDWDLAERIERQQVAVAVDDGVPVAAEPRVVGDPAVAAILAALEMAAEGGRATALDG
jgi:hypothetical protein